METTEILGGEGCLRLSQFVGPALAVPMSKSSWWAGVRAGIYPQPVKLGPRITAWRKADIRAFLERGVS
ncbi:helix-turn-helix transcriptional regulator [Methylobacterium marchantiae]|uniref:Helix-turn-helix transcriptional regulator n=1 Tax=Methylobacterium marchantiae TaxID=600331 RepID=A0ABW3WSR8_9HYPH|nr:hypothetical protein AIGOOFII_0323 [Methylobacterium marchantiae]